MIDTNDLMRGSGRTTRQMQAAAKGALFLSANAGAARHYDRDLARHLGREDLVIMSIDVLDNHRTLLGRRFPEIVVDHWVHEASGPRYRERMDKLHYLRSGLVRPS